MNGLHILGTGRAVPDQIITNDDLARRVDTNDEWIVARTGIRERRFAREGESLTQFTVAAARQALERAGLKPEDIGLCVTATVTSDRLFPSQACLIHQELGLPEDCPAFDLSAGCTGFLYAMETAAAMLPRMNRPCALLVGGELLSRIVDMDDRSTCILFGDGAGAAVLKNKESGVIDILMGSDGTKGDALKCVSRSLGNFLTGERPKLGFMTMDGQEVFRFTVKQVPNSIDALMKRNQVTKQDIKYYVLHQANERIVEAVARKLKEPMTKFPMTIAKYGNTSTASIPLLLDDMVKKGMLEDGDMIIMSGFGAGMTWGTVLLEWKKF